MSDIYRKRFHSRGPRSLCGNSTSTFSYSLIYGVQMRGDSANNLHWTHRKPPRSDTSSLRAIPPPHSKPYASKT